MAKRERLEHCLDSTPRRAPLRRSAIGEVVSLREPSRPMLTEAAAAGELDFMDEWYPIQVKQHDQVGRPDIDKFETAMLRAKRKKVSLSASTSQRTQREKSPDSSSASTP